MKPQAARVVNRFAKSRRVTIAQVAARAGVSKTTVSHVLSGNRTVAVATRERVSRAIDELAYRPDGLARSLRTKRSHMVAFILPDITNPWYPVVARGLEDGLGGAGYRTFVCNTDGRREQELEFVTDVYNRRVDGVAIVSFHVRADEIGPILDDGVPFVSVGGGMIDHPHVDIVMADDERGAFDATMRLVRGGRTRIAMIQGAGDPAQERNAGYRRALRESGIAGERRWTATGGWTRHGGAAAMLRLLADDAQLDGVFCGNDLMAIGAMDALRSGGRSVPDDVAVVGYDDIEAAALVTPGLTTVLNPAYETGATAGRLLLERMRDGYEGERRIEVLPCRLVERESG